MIERHTNVYSYPRRTNIVRRPIITRGERKHRQGEKQIFASKKVVYIDIKVSDMASPFARSVVPDDGHMGQEPWQTWSQDKKQQLYDRLLEKIEHIHSERTCKVCLSTAVARAFKPCGHLSCCAACAKQMKDCPICREPVQGSVVVVLPKPRRKALPMDFELFLQRHDYFGLQESN